MYGQITPRGRHICITFSHFQIASERSRTNAKELGKLLFVHVGVAEHGM
jgi:hypothetical protein